MKSSSVDVLIIGAGPAGTVAASVLNKKGKKVRIIEKQSFPRFVIGESLLPITMEHLEEAGLLEAADSVGFEKKYGAKFIRGEKSCTFDFSYQYTKGWSWTWQLPRADFDKVLADETEKKGVEISYNTEVTDVKFSGTDSVTSVRSAEGEEEISARFVLDCSGYGRVLPRLLELDRPAGLPPKTAFFTHVKDENRPEGTEGTQITFVVVRQDVWFWVIPFSNGVTSLGFVGEPDFFKDVQEGTPDDFKKLLKGESNFAERFLDSDFIFPPKMIHAYSKSVDKLHGPGFALAGNSAEFLDPVFSSGVAFATGSGLKSAELIDRQLNGENVDWEEEYESYVREGVEVFKSFVDGWYDGSLQEIFFTDQFNPNIKKQICSILAGYVWDKTNPIVQRHKTILQTVAKVLLMEKK